MQETEIQTALPLPIPPCEGDPTCFSFLLHGAAIGLAIAVPVGPIAVLCMQYALSRGFLIAFAAGLGAALADTFFGMLAGFGLTMVTDWIFLNKCWIQLLGGAFLCYLGAELCFTKNHKTILIDDNTGPMTALSSTFMLTLANPLTILAFMALFGYFGLVNITDNTANASMTIAGVFLGSLGWWTLLTYLAARLRTSFTDKALLRFREAGGILLLLGGGAALLSCFNF